jgi:hypothetical protein
MNRLMTLYSKNSTTASNALSPILSYNIKENLTEIKHRVGKSSQTFQLENWHHTPELCVGRWVAKKASLQYKTPIGAYTWGVWWKDQDIGAYRIHDPLHNIIAYRLDIIKDVKIIKQNNNDIIEFLDMIIDIWLWPDNNGKISNSCYDITIEDLNEMKELYQKNSLRSDEVSQIENMMKYVILHPDKIVNNIDQAIDSAIKHQEILNSTSIRNK